jgi:hypothetical protein
MLVKIIILYKYSNWTNDCLVCFASKFEEEAEFIYIEAGERITANFKTVKQLIKKIQQQN